MPEFPFVSRREPGPGTGAFTVNYFRAWGIAPENIEAIMELGCPQAHKGVVETGLGCAIVSRVTGAKETKFAHLVSIPLQPKLIRKLSLVFPAGCFRSRLANPFVAFAASRMREPTA